MATPQHKTPAPGGHEVYNIGRPKIDSLIDWLID